MRISGVMSMQKLKTKKIILLISLSATLIILLGYAGWRAFLADKYYRKTDAAYAAWRQPDQRGSNWSHIIFTSNAPTFYDLRLAGKDFSDANFSHGGFIRTHFENTKFIHANMTNSRFRFSVFKGCDLRNADLRNADLRFVLFWHADLRGANLANARLSGASIWNTDLNGANLTGADLHSAWFYQSDLRSANFKKAGMGIMYDSQTKWPKGFDADKDGGFMDNKLPVLGGR